MLLPSSAELVQAFLKDLGNVFDFASAEQPPITAKSVWVANAATMIADRDCFIVGVKQTQVSSLVISTTNETTSSLGIANNTVKDIIYACVATTFLPEFVPMRWIWTLGTKIYLNSSGGTGCILFIE